MSDVRALIGEAMSREQLHGTGMGAYVIPVVARLVAEAEERGAARVRERVEAALASRVGWPPREKDWLIATMNREAAP